MATLVRYKDVLESLCVYLILITLKVSEKRLFVRYMAVMKTSDIFCNNITDVILYLECVINSFSPFEYLP